MTIILVIVVVGFGVRAMMTLPIDAVPDVTPNVVQIVTKASGLAPPEVEKFITFPVEVSMRGLPGITEIRSISAFGLSTVWVYFSEKYDIYFARRLVMERIPAARELIPDGYGSPEMLPVSTALGEIFQFQVTGPKHSLMELRSILDWEIAPQLKSVPGVVEVNSFGGELKTFELQLDPNALVAYGISLQDVFQALEKNNSATGGGYISHSGQQEIIRGSGLIKNLHDIELIVVGNRNGVPIYVRNLGKVEFAPRIRQGAVTRDGKGEIVSGVVMMLIGENSRVVVERVKAKIAETYASPFRRGGNPPLLRSREPHQSDHQHGGTKPGRRCPAGNCDPASISGRYSCESDLRHRYSVLDADRLHWDEPGGSVGKSDEPGRDRFRPYRRWLGGNGREHFPSPRRKIPKRTAR